MVGQSTKKMSKSSCFFKELLWTPCGSYKVGDIDIDEITPIDRCTQDITGHLQVLHLRESPELKSKADLIFLCSGKCKNCMIQFFVGGTFVPYKVNDFYKVALTLLPFLPWQVYLTRKSNNVIQFALCIIFLLAFTGMGNEDFAKSRKRPRHIKKIVLRPIRQ